MRADFNVPGSQRFSNAQQPALPTPSHFEWESEETKSGPASKGHGDNGTDIALEGGNQLDSEDRR